MDKLCHALKKKSYLVESHHSLTFHKKILVQEIKY